MDQIAAAVLLGNILTLCFVWACAQFHRHDYRAPWLAYAGALMPVGYVLLSFFTAEPSPLFSALASQ